jgi:septation ring formation regulator EzrA
MTTLVEYQLSEGGTLFVETDENQQTATKASSVDGSLVVQAGQSFEQALASVKQAIATFRNELSQLETDEVEVSFGLKAVGELGFFAVAKTGTEVNFNVVLRWNRDS